MKKSVALPLILAAVFLGSSSCAEPSSRYIPTITLEAEPSDVGNKGVLGASNTLQTLFTSITKESVKTKEEMDSLDYARLKAAYPETISSVIESSVGQASTERLIREYSVHLSEVPEGGSVVIDPSSAKEDQSGEVQIFGSDVYLSYPSGESIVTHKGLSVKSSETLNDVFTMKQVDGTWKITGVRF